MGMSLRGALLPILFSGKLLCAALAMWYYDQRKILRMLGCPVWGLAIALEHACFYTALLQCRARGLALFFEPGWYWPVIFSIKLYVNSPTSPVPLFWAPRLWTELWSDHKNYWGSFSYHTFQQRNRHPEGRGKQREMGEEVGSTERGGGCMHTQAV